MCKKKVIILGSSIVTILIALLLACSGIVLEYTPDTIGIEAPISNLELVLNRDCYPRPIVVQHGEGYTKLIFDSHKRVNPKMIVYSEVAQVQIVEHPGTWQVVTYDDAGNKLEHFWALSIKAARSIADALSAVVPGKRPGA